MCKGLVARWGGQFAKVQWHQARLQGVCWWVVVVFFIGTTVALWRFVRCFGGDSGVLGG